MRHPGPRAFLDRAESWLLRCEAENNLVLGVAGSLARAEAVSSRGPVPPSSLAKPISASSPGPVPPGEPGSASAPSEPGSASSSCFLTIERGNDIVGCAFRTPPYKVALTSIPLDAIPLLARSIADTYETIPAVLGPSVVACAFGEAWSDIKGVRAVPGARQRIHVLERVTAPSRQTPGTMRLARRADLPLVARWIESFVRETGLREAGDPRAQADRLTGGDRGNPLLALWEDRTPVSMAGFPARTRHGVRIGYVYTPDRHRRRGYATALVTQVSRHVLESGFSHCVLYTDLANPTANRIYRRIGYRPVQDVIDIEFTVPDKRS